MLRKPLSPLGLFDFFGGVRLDGQRIHSAAVETNREAKYQEPGEGHPEYFGFHSARDKDPAAEPVHVSESARLKFPPRINSMLRDE